ncbi:Aldo/keto reductase [Trametopsis cervina]|nr:Aldo/keto reductase [Trametopsis cervina]
MSTSVVPTFTLNDGSKVPAFGLGCWMGPEAKPDEAYEVCLTALKAGYRHIDTAAGYGNEEAVGRAIRDSGIPRAEIFVTTKLANADHHRVAEAFETSFKKLNIEYVDLYLVHWPQAVKGNSGTLAGEVLPENVSPTFVETWKDMEKLPGTGKVRSIGVSNFSVKNLEILLPHATIKPVVNQIEYHPCLPQFELHEYHKAQDILITAYSPLGQGDPRALKDDDIVKIAESRSATPAQVILSWIVQRGIIAIAKSAQEERLKQNITLIQLTEQEIQSINDIHKKPGMHRSLVRYHREGGKVFGWTYEQLGWNFSEGGIWKD